MAVVRRYDDDRHGPSGAKVRDGAVTCRIGDHKFVTNGFLQ
jgi:hypothetical protein